MNHVEIFMFLLAGLNIAAKAEVTQGGCSCAVFSGSPLSSESLIVHALPISVSCDEEGSNKCLQLCAALAEGAKEQAPALICKKLNRHVENLKISLHSRNCNDEDWRFTGLQMNEGICCHEGEETLCTNQPRESILI